MRAGRKLCLVVPAWAAIAVVTAPIAHAHSGGQDSNGGHYCREAGYSSGKCAPLGSYHCHSAGCTDYDSAAPAEPDPPAQQAPLVPAPADAVEPSRPAVTEQPTPEPTPAPTATPEPTPTPVPEPTPTATPPPSAAATAFGLILMFGILGSAIYGLVVLVRRRRARDSADPTVLPVSDFPAEAPEELPPAQPPANDATTPVIAPTMPPEPTYDEPSSDDASAVPVAPLPASTQFCPQCGNRVATDARFCRVCGTALSDEHT